MKLQRVRDPSETIEWLDAARRDLDIARLLLSHGHWDASAFHSHQAAEKALKAVQIRRSKRFDRIHDIAALCRSVDAPPALTEHAALLRAYYTGGRYPGA